MNPTTSLNIEIQGRPHYGSDIGAVVPPMTRDKRKTELSPNPTLAMLLRKKK